MSRLSCLQGNQVHIWEWYMNSTHCPEAQAWRNFKCAEMEYAKTGIGGGLTQQAAKHHTAPHSLTHTTYSRYWQDSVPGNTRMEAHADTAHCEKESAVLHWGGRGAGKMMWFGRTALLPPSAWLQRAPQVLFQFSAATNSPGEGSTSQLWSSKNVLCVLSVLQNFWLPHLNYSWSTWSPPPTPAWLTGATTWP